MSDEVSAQDHTLMAKRVAKRKADKRYRDAHRESIRAQRKRFRETHREALDAKATAYRKTHTATVNATRRQWRAQKMGNPQASVQERERQRNYRVAHREQLVAYAQQYREQHGDILRQRDRERYATHKHRKREQARASYMRHRERHIASHRQYYAVHRARLLEQKKAYARENWEKVRASDARKRVSRRSIRVRDLSAEQWREIQSAYGYRCVYCPPDCWRCRQKKHKLTQDHIAPLSKGGFHTASNIVPACQSCNSKKGTGAPLVPVQPLLLTIAPCKKSRA